MPPRSHGLPQPLLAAAILAGFEASSAVRRRPAGLTVSLNVQQTVRTRQRADAARAYIGVITTEHFSK